MLVGGIVMALLGPPPTHALEPATNAQEILATCGSQLCADWADYQAIVNQISPATTVCP